MYEIILSTNDKIINQYIKNYISKYKLTNEQLLMLLKNKFNKSDINKIRNGTYTFDLNNFIYLTQKLNLDLEIIFNHIKETPNNLN